jgi:uncharacterized RDD family membrane protein YckC
LDNTASRGKRLGAALIDIFVVMFCVQPFIQQFKLEQYAENPFNAPTEILLKVLFFEVIVFFVLNSILLYQRGQTIGKRLLKIAIVNNAIVDGVNQKPKFAALIINRYLIQLAMVVIPLLNIVDVLIILLRSDRRCLHDMIANTKVIDLKITSVVAQPNPTHFVA